MVDGKVSPRNRAGHSMLCPYKTKGASHAGIHLAIRFTQVDVVLPQAIEGAIK